MENHSEDNKDQDILLSKTQRKQKMHALQQLGEQLVELDLKQLAELALPEILTDALLEARVMNKHGARRRQMQYIGKLMRKIDVLPIQEKLASWHSVSLQQTARFHLLERWRERLLSDEHAFTELAQKYPAADIQRLRLLARNARKERLANKPPRSYRLIFQELQAIVTEFSNKSTEHDGQP